MPRRLPVVTVRPPLHHHPHPRHRAVVDELRRCAAKAVVFTTVEIAGGTSRSCAPGECTSQSCAQPVDATDLGCLT